MSFSHLSTKLYIPPLRAGAVPRPRLTEMLSSGIKRGSSLTLLSGPAGFGKTTLLSEWIAQTRQSAAEVHIAWLSLDEGDNDPNRFWDYLIHACQTALGEVGENALALLHSPQPLPEEAVPTLLINDIASLHLSFVLILDDFHAIQNSAVQTGLLFLLEHLPQNMSLVVSSRTDPPWPLARLRARNRLIEIRAQDLRFSLEEAAAFLNQTMELSISADALASLEERTEGWIAGLQLAALSMQGRNDISAFIQAFTGSHVYIAEYLVDEVLKQQPAEMQLFLLQSSILDQLNADLCEAVTASRDVQAKLNALQQGNIFIVPLDDQGRWFRYHHLFADLLKARLQTSLSKADIQVLHQHASGWYEHNEMVAEAVDHALAAADHLTAARLVEDAALPMILQAHVRTVERWLQAIPTETIRKSPKINMAYAWMNLLRGMLPEAIPFIDRLQILSSQAETDPWSISLQAEWLAIQAEWLMSQGKTLQSRDLAIQAQKMLPEVDPNIRSMIYVTLAKAYQKTFDYARAAKVFQMLVQDARRIGDMTFEVLGSSGQAQMELKQGRLHRTFETVQEAIRRLEMSGKKVPFSATLYGEIGEVYFYWHQFDLAKEYQKRAMEISGKSGYSDPEIYFHLMLSKISQMEGDLDGSIREMEQASHLAGIIPPVMVRENMIAQQVRVYLSRDRLAAAEQLLEAEGFRFGKTFHFPALAPGAPITVEAGLIYNSAFRVLLHMAGKEQNPSNLGSGVDLAERVYQGERQCQHLLVVLETLLLLTQMFGRLGETQKSLTAVATALELAEPEGFISPFVEEGQPVADILTELLLQSPPEKVRRVYIEQLVAAFPNPPTAQRNTSAIPEVKTLAAGFQPLVEPLSARELEVLQWIALGDSNQAIAEKLVITVSAVKKHTGNIYGKLSVSSRTQAVSRARQLGLLASDP